MSKVEPEKYWPRIGEVVDGLLYVGGNTAMYPSPAIDLNADDVRQLRRRATLIKARDRHYLVKKIEALVRGAAKTCQKASGHHGNG